MKQIFLLRIMKFLRIIALLIAPLACSSNVVAGAPLEEKLYVAIEGEGKVAVLDTATLSLLKLIDLADERHTVSPHNIQVAPDGKTVWVTANGAHGGHEAKSASSDHDDRHEGGHGAMETPNDEVLVIDPETDTLIKRIPIGNSLHLAHVVLTPDSTHAYVTAQNENAIYQIDARNYQVLGKLQAPAGSHPHGLRIAPNGYQAYIALLQGKGMGILDLASGKLEALPLDGAAVQTAVTPDGKLAIASLYDTKQIAVYDTETKSVRYIGLLKPARGPVQIYPTPDNRYVYIADQGHYFGQPDGQWIFKVDLARSAVVWSIKAGAAPHGIVISKDGGHAYVTNLASDDVSVIDLKSDTETTRIAVGREPNGVSLWNRNSGGTP